MAEAKRLFSGAFAYIVPDGATFDTLTFDDNDAKVFMAERYGGFGIGYNGGGARCGSLGPFQVKGCGKNLLAGADQEVHHSYGGFKALYAIHEAIYASILERLLPLGAVRILGVMLTGPKGAYVRKDVERGWGALMVRDAVLRPANFLRARSFRPTKETSRVLLSDVSRVRRANRELYRLIGGVDGFDSYIKRFLRNCANQFTFARFMRLSHGAVTASNIAIDGKWLDLTNTTLSCSSIDTGGDNMFSPSFYEELFAPVPIACEMIETFSKYNGMAIPSDWVRAFYAHQVNIHTLLHLPYLFGQSTQLDSKDLAAPAPKIAAAVMGILSSAPTVHHQWPLALPDNDPLLSFTGSLFLSMAEDEDSRRSLIEQLKIDPVELQQLVDELASMLRTFFNGSNESWNWHVFLCRSFSCAMRRACLPEYFFKQRLGAAIDDRLHTVVEEELEAFISASVDFGSWVFAMHADDTILDSTQGFNLSFAPNSSQLILRTSHGQTHGSALDVLAAVEALPELLLHVEGFNCKRYLLRVLKGLVVLEHAR